MFDNVFQIDILEFRNMKLVIFFFFFKKVPPVLWVMITHQRTTHTTSGGAEFFTSCGAECWTLLLKQPLKQRLLHNLKQQ